MHLRIIALLFGLIMVPAVAPAQQGTGTTALYQCANTREYVTTPTHFSFVDVYACSTVGRAVGTGVPPSTEPSVSAPSAYYTCVTVYSYYPVSGYDRWCGHLATGIVVDPLLETADVNFTVLGQAGSMIAVNLHFVGSGDRNPLAGATALAYGMPPGGTLVGAAGLLQMDRFASVSGFVTTSAGWGGPINRPAPAARLYTGVYALALIS